MLMGVGGKKWQGSGGNISTQPFCIIVPNTLQDQYVNELCRYLTKGLFDIILYSGKYSAKGCSRWFQNCWDTSRIKNGNKILISTVTVSVSLFIMSVALCHDRLLSPMLLRPTSSRR